MTDKIEATELHLFITNTGNIWRNVEHYVRNLERKRTKGTYDHALAEKGFLPIAMQGAKQYAREFSVGTDWAAMFPPAVRRETAALLLADIEAEWAAGNSWK